MTSPQKNQKWLIMFFCFTMCLLIVTLFQPISSLAQDRKKIQELIYKTDQIGKILYGSNWDAEKKKFFDENVKSINDGIEEQTDSIKIFEINRKNKLKMSIKKFTDVIYAQGLDLKEANMDDLDKQITKIEKTLGL